MIQSAASSTSNSLALALGMPAASGEDGTGPGDFAALLETSLAAGSPTGAEGAAETAASPLTALALQMRQVTGKAVGKGLPLELLLADPAKTGTTAEGEESLTASETTPALATVQPEIVLPGLVVPAQIVASAAPQPQPQPQPQPPAPAPAPAAATRSTADSLKQSAAAQAIRTSSASRTALAAATVSPPVPSAQPLAPLPTTPSNSDAGLASPVDLARILGETAGQTNPTGAPQSVGSLPPTAKAAPGALARSLAALTPVSATVAQVTAQAAATPSILPLPTPKTAAETPQKSAVAQGLASTETNGALAMPQTSVAAPQIAGAANPAPAQLATPTGLTTAAPDATAIAAKPASSSEPKDDASAPPAPELRQTANTPPLPTPAGPLAIESSVTEAAKPAGSAAGDAAPAAARDSPAVTAQPMVIPADAPTLAPDIAPATAPATASVQSGHDFAALVDRLVDARDAAAPQTVHAALSHSEFGKVSLRFDQDAKGLSVAMSSADPGFAGAVQASAASAQSQTASDNGSAAARQEGRQDPRQETRNEARNDGFGQQQASGSPSGQSQASERNGRNSQNQTETRSGGRQAGSEHQADDAADTRGGIYA
jgi:hypothetical protein